MSAKRTSWNEFSSSMASAVICLFTGRKFNFSKYIFDSLVRNVDSLTKFYMYPRFLQLMIRKQVGDLSSHTTKYSSPALTQKVFANMRRIGKGCFGVETPFFERMIVAQQVGEGATEVNVEDVFTAGVVDEGAVRAAHDEVPAAVDKPSIPSPPPPTQPPPPSQDIPSTSQVQLTLPPPLIAQPQSPQHQPQLLHDAGISMDLLQHLLNTCTTLIRRVENLEQDKIAQAPKITMLKQRVKKLERRNKASKLKRLKKVGTSQRIETSDDTVMDDVSKQGRMIADMDADGRQAESQAQIYQIDLKHADKVLSMQDDEVKPAELQEVVEVVTTAKLITEDEAYARELEAELNKNIDSDEVTDHVHRKEKDDNAVKKYQALKRKPQTEAQARKNMMIYLRNVARFMMDYFKGMTYDDIRPIFEKKFNSNVAFLLKTKEQMDAKDSRELKRLSESQEDKAFKKQKLDEEVEELKRHLIIVPNDEDDVYTEATPLALKVPVVDYEIYTENNKPYYKIKRADDSHQLYLSFLSMLRNFDREDLEVLWRLVKERFTSTKHKNFSDDFLLTILGAMFEKPDIITFTTTHLILLIKRKYPLTRFTLDQMLNNARLEVEEDSKVSLELLRKSKDGSQHIEVQLQTVDYASKEKMPCNNDKTMELKRFEMRKWVDGVAEAETMTAEVGTTLGDIGIWEVGSWEKLVLKNFKVKVSQRGFYFLAGFMADLQEVTQKQVIAAMVLLTGQWMEENGWHVHDE
nr:hypothetical protein [Tanacetum cinerariifolium]